MKDKPQDHDWIPRFLFESTDWLRPVMIILYCPHCKMYRYQYGEHLI